jgi:hypothetical protein
MSAYTSIAQFLSPKTEVSMDSVDGHPGDFVVRFADTGLHLTIHLDASTAAVADRIAAAFTEAAAKARAATPVLA